MSLYYGGQRVTEGRLGEPSLEEPAEERMTEDEHWAAVADLRLMHRSARLILAIDLVEKLIDQVPEYSQEWDYLWERLSNLTRALVANRRLQPKGF